MSHILFWGAVNGFLAVALGAFGAHGLKQRLAPDLLTIYHTGVEYHFYHAMGLCIIGILTWIAPQVNLFRTAGWTMLVGIVIFSGSLYLLAITGQRWLGAITPFGGLAFLAAWAMLAYGVLRWKPDLSQTF